MCFLLAQMAFESFFGAFCVIVCDMVHHGIPAAEWFRAFSFITFDLEHPVGGLSVTHSLSFFSLVAANFVVFRECIVFVRLEIVNIGIAIFIFRFIARQWNVYSRCAACDMSRCLHDESFMLRRCTAFGLIEGNRIRMNHRRLQSR